MKDAADLNDVSLLTLAQSAVAAVQAWAGRTAPRPFTVKISNTSVIPLAYPLGQPATIVVPAHLLLAHNRAALYADLVHETAHMVLYTPRSPLFSEGFAVAASYALAPGVEFPWRPCDGLTLHHYAASLGRQFDLADHLAGGRQFSDWRITHLPAERQRIAYTRAGSFVTWLLDNGGHSTFAGLLDDVSAGNQEDSAFEARFGERFEHAQRRWLDFLGSLSAGDGAPQMQTTAAATTRKPARGSSLEPSSSSSSSSWILAGDTVVGGNSRGDLVTAAGGFELNGTLGDRGGLRFLTVTRFLRPDRAARSLASYEGICFEARGDGKSYQLAVMTEQARSPGEELMSLFEATDEWRSHRVPFARLRRFTGPPLAWTGDAVLALKWRAFGYQADAVRLAVRDVTFFGPSDEAAGMTPLLKPSIQVVRESADACAFIASEQQIFRCRGKTTPLLLDKILPLLDGRHPVELIAARLDGQLSAAGVATLIDMLARHGVVTDAEADDPATPQTDGADTTIAELHAFLAHHGRQPNRMINDLRRARVAVVAGGPLLPPLVDALAGAGVGAVDVLVGGAARGTTWPDAARPGTPSTRIAVHELRAADEVTGRATLGITVAQSEFDDAGPALSLSAACARGGVPCLHVRLTREAEAWIGPLQVVGGACLQCLRGRIRANLRGWRELDRAAEQPRQPGAERGEPHLWRLFACELAAMTAMEALKYLTGLQPTELVGHCRVVDLISHDSSLQPVLRLPRCGLCGPRPDDPVRPWHADEVQLDRTLIAEGSRAPDVETA